MRILFVLIGIGLFSSLRAGDGDSSAFNLKQYYFVMLTKGPSRDQDSATTAQIQKGHLDNIAKLSESGKLIVAGPFGDDGFWRGIFIFDVPSEEEVEALLQTDPAIRSGRLAYEIHPWWTAQGGSFK